MNDNVGPINAGNVTLSIPKDAGFRYDKVKIDVSLVEDEDKPGLIVSINPPGFMAKVPGAWVSALITLDASDNQPSFQSEGWLLDVDLSGWIDVYGQKLVEDEAVGSITHSMKLWVFGKVRNKLKRARVTFKADIKDAFVSTGFHFGVNLMISLAYTTLALANPSLHSVNFGALPSDSTEFL